MPEQKRPDLSRFHDRLHALWSGWPAPDAALRVHTIDAHAAGEPLRVILSGFPMPAADSILALRRFTREHHDDVRTALMWEPRGHADMYGCILTPSVSADADFGVLFTHNEGYSTMCGHGIIAVTTVVLEIGLFAMIEPVTTVRIDTPAGLVVARAHIEQGRVQSVAFRNVASFALELDATVDVPPFGRLQVDLGFGGAFYASLPAASVGLEITPQNVRALIDAGMAVKRALMANREFAHPEAADLGFLYGTIFTGPPSSADVHSRNVCIFAEGEVDRSPTGTGVSARLAIHHARGEVPTGEPIVIESIIGSRFSGRVLEETKVGPHPAVVPEVQGRAWITGRHEFLLDPEDPLVHGFLVR